ncbi:MULTISPECIES: OTU domain-containing protein [unclassified Wolbachia]|uniref:hypothetical protein n=1 Tax=unclassified Wolbachia TaxID=2640676 RepID=UPI0002D250FC|nr:MULTISPECIES: hypothetical protein [unclassified Wolbachia]AGK00501.1 hypothetical protein wHa_10930 [Wolbachia endosymbiont of Drosophila simulans wHa]
MKEPNYTREPIALFRQIKEKKKSSNLLHNLKSAYSKKLKIGAALKTGDCFFDSVAQGLNELKPGHRFTAKSLRKDCADYAENKKDSRWVFDEITKNIAEGYAVPMIGSNGNVMKDNQNNIIPDNIASFDRYLKDIRSMATEASLPIWGRPGIEGRMICDKYEVELDIYSIEEDSQKVTVTKITAHDDDLEVFIQGVNLDQLKIDNSKKTVGVVNYIQHFVPLLSGISEDIKEDQQVSSEAILGTGKRVPTSDQSEKEVQQEIINISASATVYTDKEIPFSHQLEQKTRQEGINASASATVYTDREIPTSNQSEQKVQQEIINTNTSAPVLQIYTDKKIPSSHQQEQKTQQKEIQKKLINSYRKEAIYVIATVITAIAFTASAIAAIITQAIPFACLAGTALVAACVCVYQLTQSHKDINELKSELGKGQEDNAHTFLEKVGLKMHDLINKAISKV